MKKFNVLALSAAIAAGSLTSGTAVAGASANVGYVSDYYFRGVAQAASSASAGLDYEHESGLFAGTWWGDVDTGLETDYYVGYAGEMEGLSYSLSYIVYDYTDEFDDKYSEINIGLGYGPVSIEFATGDYDDAAESEYTYAALTAEHEGFYVTFGSWGDDLDTYGSFTEVGYGAEVGGFDMGISIINNDEDADTTGGALGGGDGETTMIFSLAKSFDL